MTLSRRAVLSAAAWSAPIVALAVAAPLAAASEAAPTITAVAAEADGWIEVVLSARYSNGQGAAVPVTFQRGDDDGFGGIEWVDVPDYSTTLNDDGEMALLWPVGMYPAGRFRVLAVIEGIPLVTVFPAVA